MKKSDLFKIAKDLEDRYVALDAADEHLTNVFASSIANFEKLASECPDDEVGAQDLERVAALAYAFDKSGDPELQAEAAVLDDILLAIASPKSALAALNLVYDKELEELRAERRAQDLEEKYKNPIKKLHEMHNHQGISDAVESQVKRYRPLEAPLSTRYSPDRPGVSLMRITDRVYQDPTTGKIYDYASGYVTEKGNEIPGGGVENQIPDINEHQSRSIFTTRDGVFDGNK